MGGPVARNRPRLQCPAQCVGRRPAVFRILLEAARDREREILGNAVHGLVQDRRGLGDLLHQDARHGRGVERQRPAGHLVCHHPQRIEIRSPVDLALARRLLRAHVLRRPDRDPDPGQRGAGDLGHRLRDTEIRHHHPAPGPLEQDVVGLDVAVNHRNRVCSRQGVGGSFMMRRTSSAGSLPGLEPATEGLALDQAHHKVDDARALTHVMDRDDMGMRQPGGRLCLSGESLADFLLEGQLRREHLDGDATMEPFIAGAVHHAHPPTADFTFECVNIAQRLLQALRERPLMCVGWIGHPTIGSRVRNDVGTTAYQFAGFRAGEQPANRFTPAPSKPTLRASIFCQPGSMSLFGMDWKPAPGPTYPIKAA